MHPLLVLDALFLMLLSLPIVMMYKILPVESTPYWLFGVLFLSLVIHLFVSLNPQILKNRIQVWTVKRICLLLVLTISFFGVLWTAMVDRARTAPEYNVHDGILQEEAAIRYLVTGKNPYRQTYFGTFVEKFRYSEEGNPEAVNPALYHFVMPPWYLVFPVGLYFTTPRLIGFFDARMATALAAVSLVILFLLWFKDPLWGNVAIVVTLLSPLWVDYIIEGRSDLFALSWFFWALYLLEYKKYALSAIMFVLSVLSKQTMWFAIPFYMIYLYSTLKTSSGKEIHYTAEKRFIKYIGLMVLGVCIVAGPFLLWDYRAFIDSTVLYLSGSTQHGYPVSGYGWGMILKDLGFITDIHAYYPFIFWQIVFFVPVLLLSLHILRKKQTISVFILGYSVSLFIFWYFSRYFNNSHTLFVSIVATLGILKGFDEKKIIFTKT